MKYASVIVDNRASQVDRPFTYIINPSLTETIRPGMRVIVPFGRGNKPVKGFVIKIDEDFSEDYKLKEIIDVLDDKPLISKYLIQLGIWMKDEYLSPYIDAFQPILPPGDYKEINTFIELLEHNINEKDFNLDELKIIEYLKDKEIVLLSDLKLDLKLNDIFNTISRLEKEEILQTLIDIRTTVLKKIEKRVKVNNLLPKDSIYDLIGSRSKKQLQIYEYLLDFDDVSINKLVLDLGTTLSTVKALETKGAIIIYDKDITRDPIKRFIPYYDKHILNEAQNLVFNRIQESANNNLQDKFLIHGVTGSGKTEVYLQLVQEMLHKDKDSIILVPEISLTPQTIDRFVGRFGDRVAVIHSKLSQGERFDQWRSIKEGRVKIVVGARSAIFAPFNNLGLIVIDEEHENTYKSTQNPKYDTIDIASKRCEIEGSILIMGTATPSIETYYKAQNGEYILLELLERANKQELPEVQLVDMRDELQLGNKSIFSFALHDAIKANLEANKQTILFLNRRGFSTFVSCRSCGYVATCSSCDISMTYHKNVKKLRCHYCGATENPPNICPKCGSKYIKYFGIGTEQVEQSTREMFPEARVVRMDSDTTTVKGSYDTILEDMKNKNIDILIGTQMISKGLDFPDVTLVGIIAADTTLNLPDFRSPEKAFQLVTQVAGRSGRGDTLGNVILQTYNPDHYSIVFSQNQDYLSFYNAELPLRREFLYPPFINLISILIYGDNNVRVKRLISEIGSLLGEEMIKEHGQELGKYLIGPNPAPLEKIKNNFRWQIILKCSSENMEWLKLIIKRVCILNEYKLDIEGIKFSIDINPNSTL